MAEMPEVEILVRDMQRLIVGRTIEGADVLLAETIRFPPPPEFEMLVAGREVLSATRRAKHMLLDLSGHVLLAMHCMLDGTLRLVPNGSPLESDAVLRYTLDGDDDLRFLDDLGYARAAAGSPDEVWQRLKLAEIGPEVIDPGFDSPDLAAILRKRRGVLKSVLVNQKILAGLGNRDADESAWTAGIDPRRAASSITEDEAVSLLTAMRSVLDEGISQGGTMTDLLGQRGHARHRRNIYGRAGMPCPRCDGAVQSTRIGGQVTFFCPECQK